MLSQKGTTKALDYSYSYDKRGLITSINDGAVSGQNRSFTYNGLAQLTAATGPWGNASFAYDAWGNMTKKLLGDRTIVMTHDARNRLTSYTDSKGDDKSLSYDARGNVTKLGAQNFTYDMADQPRALSGAVTGSFRYDGHKRRVKAVQDGETIYNIYDASGSLVHIDNATTNERTDYIKAAGLTLARLVNGTATVMHPDHLGSAVAGSNTSGGVAWRELYSPFGIASETPAANDNRDGFTGHIRDKATGLTYMQARYYDPITSRFLSIDPVDFLATGDPSYFNRYAYTANNPVNAIDPDGRDSFLVSRPVKAAGMNTGGRHMFVITNANSLGDSNATRFSGGPSEGHDPALVPLNDQLSNTGRDDAATWNNINQPNSKATFVRISSDDIPDQVMEEVGDAALGHPDYDLGAVPGGNDGANSNSFARAIVDHAARISGKDPASIPNPAGWHPNVDQADAVNFDQNGLDKAQEIMNK